uniref:Extended synaptotagmin-like protein 2a n=1 Tax=Scophthalmus maximus TaxID=52904 RepID=A0A8D2ZVW1_SCOMX
MSNRMEGSAGPGVGATKPVAAPPSPVSSAAGPPLAPVALEDEQQQSSLTDVTQMWVNFAKTFAVIFPIYVLGYLEFSFSWVLIGLAALFYWRRNHGAKDYRINRALAFLDHEERVSKQTVPTAELPPWVHYPDVERVEWLNKTVKQMWPFICQFVDKLFRETIEPAVKAANPHLSSFCFTKIDMGNKPLRVNGVKVYTENVDKRQVIMDLQISFIGNTEIDVDIKKYYCRAGIKSIQLNGVMRVVMEPLLGDMPLIGALSVFFLKKPLLDINWTGLTNMLDIPGVNGLCDNIIQDIIYSYLVLPNSIKIPLVGEAALAQLRFPIPKGVLRIHFIEAQDLLSKDKMLGGLIKGKSDPYGVVQVGTQVFKSKVIHETLNPKWNEVYEVSGGKLSCELKNVWFVLEDVASGKLHLRLEWLSLLPSPEKLDQALMSIKADRGQANDGLSSALLVVFLDSARNLPRNPLEFNQAGLKKASVSKAIKSGKKVTSDPSPFVQFTVGHKSFESKTRYKTNEPVWEEAFTFLIHNPKSQELQVEVKDEKHECSLGTITLPLSRLLEADDMTLNQRFPLKNSGPGCTVKMKMALRVRVKDPSPASNSNPSSVQVRKGSNASQQQPSDSPRPHPSTPDIPGSGSGSVSPGSTDLGQGGRGGGRSLADSGRSSSNLAISGSQQYLAGGKEPTPSIASDISNPYATQELQQRLQQLQNGSGPSHFPLGEVQLTPTRFYHGSDPYVRLYLLPDKRRSGRRKTHTFKKTLNPVYDQTFEFSVSLVELHRRTLDVAVKNGGGLLSKHKGLLGKVGRRPFIVFVPFHKQNPYELSEDGLTKPPQL